MAVPIFLGDDYERNKRIDRIFKSAMALCVAGGAACIGKLSYEAGQVAERNRLLEGAEIVTNPVPTANDSVGVGYKSLDTTKYIIDAKKLPGHYRKPQ